MEKMQVALDSIPPRWREIIVDDSLEGIISSLPDDITPPLGKIFEWARVTPFERVRVVIIAQDPYPRPGDATGLAFSCKSSKSTDNIFKALIKCRIMSRPPDVADFTYLARQGILLLNRSLTTKINEVGAHRSVWEKYTQNLINRLEEKVPQPLTFMLWGLDAKAIKCKGRRLEYCHPAARDGGFVDCPHFLEILTIYPDIEWDTNRNEVENVYTDGSCDPNDKSKESRGGYAAYFTSSKTIIIGNIEVDKYYASNIRAEGRAILEVMREYRKNNRTDAIRICTDSQFWINMIQKFMPNWSESKHKSMENSDLTMSIKKGWKLVGRNMILQHVYAHKKRGVTEHTVFNDLVDRAAKFARENLVPGEKRVMSINEFNKAVCNAG